MFCVKCGRKAAEDDKFCSGCGNTLLAEEKKEKNEWQILLQPDEEDSAPVRQEQPVAEKTAVQTGAEQHQQPAAGQSAALPQESGQYYAPFNPQQAGYGEGEKAGFNLKKALIIAVAVFVLLAASGAAVFALRGIGSDPEKAVEKMFAAMQAKDMDEIKRLSVYSDEINDTSDETSYYGYYSSGRFENYIQQIENICDRIQGGSIAIKDYITFNEYDLSYVGGLSQGIKDVEELALVYYYYMDKEGKKVLNQSICLKVRGKWYTDYLRIHQYT